MTEKTLTQKIIKEAGQELKKLFFNRNFKTSFKSKHEIVTTADKLSEKIIIKNIKKYFPTHSILSEEAGLNKQKSDFLWIIDPLDGTTNFFMHNPLFSISIGLAYKNEIILGAIYFPILDELYFAEKGKGAFLNNKKIFVSKINKLEKSFLTFCHGSKITDIKKSIKIYTKLKLKSADFRQLGSAAIELAFVARGTTEAIMIPGANSWDVAACALLVFEAGGSVVDFNNKPWNLKSKNILAGNGKFNSAILKIINS